MNLFSFRINSVQCNRVRVISLKVYTINTSSFIVNNTESDPLIAVTPLVIEFANQRHLNLRFIERLTATSTEVLFCCLVGTVRSSVRKLSTDMLVASGEGQTRGFAEGACLSHGAKAESASRFNVWNSDEYTPMIPLARNGSATFKNSSTVLASAEFGESVTKQTAIDTIGA